MRTADKILSLAELAEVLAPLRAAGQRIVQAHGCFDLLHIGHVRYLQKAARLGDVLVVTVTPDRFVNKGPHRPAFPEELRAESLAALECVDYVALNEWPTAVECLALLRPHLYAKGAEFRDNRTPEIVREEAAVTELGAEIAYVEDLTSSSSELINRHLSPFPREVDGYLAALAERYSPADLVGWLEQARALRVLVVGETLLDEYYYTNTLQRSAHAPVLAVRYRSSERFLGGAANVANHLAGFCDQVGLLSLVGDRPDEQEWIAAQLRDNVQPSWVARPEAPTVTRRQYRESYFAQPLFECYFLEEEPLGEALEQEFCDRLAAALPGYDLVLAADYGHGLLSPRAVELLCRDAACLAVNVQVDAANVGYHTVGRYPRADLLCLAEQELRLETRSRAEEVGPLLAQVAQRLGSARAVVMRGGRGCLGYAPDAGVVEAPALATRVVDRGGATDAFLAVTALCACRAAPLDVLCFLGNVAGAEAVATIGTRDPLSALRLRRHVESLLK